MNKTNLMEWGFFLITLCNILLIALVIFLLWQRYFASDSTKEEKEAEAVPADVPEVAGALANRLLADAQQQLLPIGQAMSDSLDLVEGLDGVDGESYPDWKKTNQPYIDQLLSHREALELKVDNMADKLARAHKVVAGLHVQNRELRAAEAQAQRLQTELARTQSTLSQVRQERDTLMVEVQQVRATAGLAPRAAILTAADEPASLPPRETGQ